MRSEGYSIAVVGATGTVGREVATILAERHFPVRRIKFLASERSLGETGSFGGEDYPVEAAGEQSFAGVDLAFFCADARVSERLAPAAAAAGAVVIDTSWRFRDDPDVPLVVPEVNAFAIAQFRARRIIASPASAALVLAVVLHPLDLAATVVRVVASSYQAASGGGRRGIEDLSRQTTALMAGGELDLEGALFPRRLAFNCIPEIGEVEEDGQTREESRLCRETLRILGRQDLRLAVTCVQVPIFFVHSLAVWLETRRRLAPEEAREILRQAPGIVLCDEKSGIDYPTPAEVAGTDATYVGRVRGDRSGANALLMWIAVDNVRKGAALNAVQIAEILVRDHL